jgi:hypothetical protein
MAETGKPSSSKSAIALFIFLGVILLFLPCLSIIIVKFRRSRNRKAQRKAEEGSAEYWASMAAVEALPRPQPVAEPAAIQRDARGNKVLPNIYRNKAGIFERATLNENGTYEVPKSFREELKKESAFNNRRISLEEESRRGTKFEPMSDVRPPRAAADAEHVYIPSEGRLLTPQQNHGADDSPFVLQPVPKKNLKKKLDDEGTPVQTVSSGRADVGRPDRVRSKVAHVDRASLDVVDLHSHPDAPPGWI